MAAFGGQAFNNANFAGGIITSDQYDQILIDIADLQGDMGSVNNFVPFSIAVNSVGVGTINVANANTKDIRGLAYKDTGATNVYQLPRRINPGNTTVIELEIVNFVAGDEAFLTVTGSYF